MSDEKQSRKLINNGQNKTPIERRGQIKAGQMKSNLTATPTSEMKRPAPPKGSGGKDK